MLNLEEEEEKKEKIFEVKEISKEKNKLEEQVFAYNIPPCIAVVGSHHRDLNWNYSLDHANYFYYERD